MKNRTIYKKGCVSLLSVWIFIFALVGCSKTDSTDSNSNSETDTQATTLNYEKFDINVEFSEFDLDDSWEESTSTIVTLSGDSATVSGDGATVEGSIVTINLEGTYVVSGSLDDGQIIVNVSDTENVKLVLNGVKITCSNSAPIYVKNADKTAITLAAGSTNALTDGTGYEYTDETKEEPNAAIFSNDDLTINGSGALEVNANFNNGIAAKDDLKIVNGNITVTAINNGITGKDSILVKEGTITVNAGADGIKTNNSAETDQGYLYIGSGTFTIVSGEDGIQADTCMVLADGIYNIQSGGGSRVSSSDSNSNWGNWGDQQNQSSSSTSESSAKGIKAGVDLTIQSGTFTIDSSDDSLHSSDTLTIENGTINLTSGDDGIHADTNIAINNGNITITKSYEGIESAQINVNGGTIEVTSSDDGFNAGGGNDSSATNDRQGQSPFSDTGEYFMNVNGGNIMVNASGDGLDSNGSMTMTGGTVVVFGPTNDGNGALDYNGSFTVTGGSLIAAGSAGMAQAISESSSQYCISIYFSSTQAAGTTVVVKEENGNEVASVTPTKTFASVVISNSELSKGATYSVYANGTLVDTCTISSIVTTIGNSSSMGGQQPGGQRGGF